MTLNEFYILFGVFVFGAFPIVLSFFITYQYFEDILIEANMDLENFVYEKYSHFD